MRAVTIYYLCGICLCGAMMIGIIRSIQSIPRTSDTSSMSDSDRESISNMLHGNDGKID